MNNSNLNEMGYLNFLYCFDEKYNQQAFSSIISLLDCVSEKINIYVIYNKTFNNEYLPRKIRNHKKLNTIKFLIFQDINNEFPNIQNSHLTEATYYRLFIEKYVPNNINYLTYIDSDIICLKNPIIEIKEKIKILKASPNIFMARTEYKKSSKKENKIYERLDMDGPYFNAGFLIINIEKWRKNNLTENLIIKMNKLSKSILHWDQDVLNSYFDGKYIEIENKFNFNAYDKRNEVKNLEEIIFLHYVGSKKPWVLSGIFNKFSEYYHYNFRKINNKYYHITHTWKRNSMYIFVNSLLKLKILNLKYPLMFLKDFVKSFKND